MPADAALVYAETLAVIRLVPWNGDPLSKANPDGAVRIMTFGPDGRGMVMYLILEREQQVDVISVTWAG